MTILTLLTQADYESVKDVLALFDRTEAEIGRPLRDHPVKAFRIMDEARVTLRAALEGYEAVNRES